MVFIGNHFGKNEDLVFENISINYFLLEKWTGISGFELNLKKDNPDKGLNIDYSFPEEIEINFDNFKIIITFNLNFSGDRVKDFNLQQTTFIKFQPDKPIHFTEYLMNYCYHIQNFLSLALQRAINPILITGQIKNQENVDNGQKFKDISIYHMIRQFQDSNDTVAPFNVLFLFSDIKENFEEHLKIWFSKFELLKPVYDLYFGTIYNPSMYLEQKFLNFIQALESFHRRLFNDKYVIDEEFENIYEQLMNSIPSDINRDFRESLIQKLKYLNEFSLRKRLKEIFNTHKIFLDELIKNPDKFQDDTVNTRNYLIHYDKDLETKAKQGNDLIKLINILNIILEICFLYELEIPEEKIKSLISRTKRYQSLKKFGY